MPAKKKTVAPSGLTTTSSFMGNEGASKDAPLVVREEGSDSIHADPENPPSGSMGPLADPDDEMRAANGFTKMVALMNFQCYGSGSGMYELRKGREVWVHTDHTESMKNSGVVRDFDPDRDE